MASIVTWIRSTVLFCNNTENLSQPSKI